MNTFYSIVSATINPHTNEKISLGLVLSDGRKSLFSFSGNRLSIVKSIVSKEQYLFIRDYLNSFDRIIDRIDKNPEKQISLEDLEDKIIINEPYFDYMSIYGQNIITVSKPTVIDINVNDNNYKKLFFKFIHSEEEPESKAKKKILQVKDSFLDKVSDHFSIEKELLPKEHKGLKLPVTVDMFGKNEQNVIGQFIDLERNLHHIKSDYLDFRQICENISYNKLFLITNEPDKKRLPYQHDFWQLIREENQNKYSFTDISEVETIYEYAKEHGVKPC